MVRGPSLLNGLSSLDLHFAGLASNLLDGPRLPVRAPTPAPHGLRPV